MLHIDIMSAFFILLALHCFTFKMHEAATHGSHLRDSGRVFLTNLYHKLVDENGNKNFGASEIIHAVQGKGMTKFIRSNYVLVC